MQFLEMGTGFPYMGGHDRINDDPLLALKPPLFKLVKDKLLLIVSY